MFKSEPGLLDNLKGFSDPDVRGLAKLAPGGKQFLKDTAGRDLTSTDAVDLVSKTVMPGTKVVGSAGDLEGTKRVVIDLTGSARPGSAEHIIATPSKDQVFATDKAIEAKLFGQHMPQGARMSDLLEDLPPPPAGARPRGFNEHLARTKQLLKDKLGTDDVFIKGRGAGRSSNVRHLGSVTGDDWRELMAGRGMQTPQTLDSLFVQPRVPLKPVGNVARFMENRLAGALAPSRKDVTGNRDDLLYRVTAIDGKVVPYTVEQRNTPGSSFVNVPGLYSSKTRDDVATSVQQALDALPSEHRKGVFGFDVGINRQTGKPVIIESNPSTTGDISTISGALTNPLTLSSVSAAIKGRIPWHIQASRAAQLAAAGGLGAAGIGTTMAMNRSGKPEEEEKKASSTGWATSYFSSRSLNNLA
jgi:hypothetical protein